MDINRITSGVRGRSDAVSCNGTAYLVAYDPTAADGIQAQTLNCLRFLDEKLAQVGSGKTALLQVTVFLSDMSLKAEMNEVWCDWIGSADNWPQRVCVGADLGDDVTLVEITAIATQLEN